MGTTITKHVFTGKDARVFVSSIDVTYSDANLRKVIFDDKNLNTYLMLTKTIGSQIEISGVLVLDENKISEMLS